MTGPERTLGSRWRKVGPQKPKTGNEIFSQQLEAALRTKQEFSKEEVAAFDLEDLRLDSFIKVEDDDQIQYEYYEQAVRSRSHSKALGKSLEQLILGKKHLALGPDGLTLTRKATAGTPARPAATAKEGKEKDKKAGEAKPKAEDGKAPKPKGAMTGASPDPMDPVNRLKILGAIDLDESRPIPAQISEAMQRSALRVMDVFKGFDTERLDGRISRNEFKRGLVALQFDVPEKYLDELFDSFDPDGSGELELNEFTKMLRGHFDEIGSAKRPCSSLPRSSMRSVGQEAIKLKAPEVYPLCCGLRAQPRWKSVLFV